MITLTFRPVGSESATLVRGAYFRICADGTLRGPDNAVTATYADGLWQLGHKRHLAFECGGPVYLRVTRMNGRRESSGPYGFLKASDGAVFTHDSCLGAYAARGESSSPTLDQWREIAFLSTV